VLKRLKLLFKLLGAFLVVLEQKLLHKVLHVRLNHHGLVGDQRCDVAGLIAGLF